MEEFIKRITKGDLRKNRDFSTENVQKLFDCILIYYDTSCRQMSIDAGIPIDGSTAI